ncbi:CMP199.5L [Camelpox virus CMS]|uniref:CMP199.5L n=1 Tax=Camelpox virus (strain CMS) TaxID=203172 RepID=Q8QPZ9_CAMPS|nr:CMP199.5L [Camelpox virus CMS]
MIWAYRVTSSTYHHQLYNILWFVLRSYRFDHLYHKLCHRLQPMKNDIYSLSWVGVRHVFLFSMFILYTLFNDGLLKLYHPAIII